MEKLALLITSDGDSNYSHIRARFVRWDTEKKTIYNIIGRWDDKKTKHFDGLQANCQISNQGDDFSVYGFELNYMDVYVVDLDKASRMAKTLKSIQRSLDKLSNSLGYTNNDFAAWVLRIAQITKSVFVVETKNANSSTYDDNEYQIVDAQSAQCRINSLIDDVREKYQYKAA